MALASSSARACMHALRLAARAQPRALPLRQLAALSALSPASSSSSSSSSRRSAAAAAVGAVAGALGAFSVAFSQASSSVPTPEEAAKVAEMMYASDPLVRPLGSGHGGEGGKGEGGEGKRDGDARPQSSVE